LREEREKKGVRRRGTFFVVDPAASCPLRRLARKKGKEQKGIAEKLAPLIVKFDRREVRLADDAAR